MSDLDFSGLMNVDNADNTPNTVDSPVNEVESNNAQTRLRNQYKSIQSTYKRLERMKHDTGALKVQLIKDMNAGDKDIKDLLADALTLISTATNDTAFLTSTSKALKDNY